MREEEYHLHQKWLRYLADSGLNQEEILRQAEQNMMMGLSPDDDIDLKWTEEDD